VNANNEAACPFCGESILLVARKCKHCGEWLQANGPAANMSVTLANNISLNVKRVAYARNDEELTILANDTPVGQLKPAEALSVKFTAPGDVNLTFGISTPTGMKLMRTATFALPSGGASAIIRVESSGPVLISIRDSSGALIPARGSAVRGSAVAGTTQEQQTTVNFKKLEPVCAVVLLVAFFLPWVSIGGIVTLSGYNFTELVRTVNAMGVPTELNLNLVYLIWLIPVSANAILYAEYSGRSSRVLSIVGGAIPLLVAGYAFIKLGFDMVDTMSIGAVLTVAAGLGLVIAAIRNQDSEGRPL